MEALAHRLLQPIEQLSSGPGRGEIDVSIADGEGQPLGGRLGCTHDEPLGQINPVVHVAKGPIGLQGGEFGAVASVDSLVPEVPGYLEHPLVAADHQALEVELGGDAQTEVDVEGVGVGHEGTGQRPAGLRLEDGCVHLDEVFGHQQAAQSSNGLEADVEDTAAGRVGQQISSLCR